MKLIEALKRLPVIEKRIQKNLGLINDYCCAIDNGNMDLAFETPEKQQAEVISILQAVNDLVAEKASLRRRLAMTNAKTVVTIGGMEKTITEWIEYRERGMTNVLQAYLNLNTREAESKLRNGNINIDPDKGFKTVRFYDEKQRNEMIERYENIRDNIDAQLEKVNATTDLIETD